MCRRRETIRRKEEKITVGCGGEKIRHKEKKAEPHARKGVMTENKKKKERGTSGQKNWKKRVDDEEEEKMEEKKKYF